MAQITEVAPDLFRITTFLEPFNLQFSQFLVRDAEPLLFHTGPRALFPAVKEAVGALIDIQSLRWIGFSHFEADECGSLPGCAGRFVTIPAPGSTGLSSLSISFSTFVHLAHLACSESV